MLEATTLARARPVQWTPQLSNVLPLVLLLPLLMHWIFCDESKRWETLSSHRWHWYSTDCPNLVHLFIHCLQHMKHVFVQWHLALCATWNFRSPKRLQVRKLNILKMKLDKIFPHQRWWIWLALCEQQIAPNQTPPPFAKPLFPQTF